MGNIAKNYGDDYIDITTRAQIELRYINIEDIPTILKKLDDVGLTSYQTGVDNFRNIVTDPLDKDGYDNILPSFELLKKIQSKFLLDPDWISVLPRNSIQGYQDQLSTGVIFMGMIVVLYWLKKMAFMDTISTLVGKLVLLLRIQISF